MTVWELSMSSSLLDPALHGWRLGRCPRRRNRHCCRYSSRPRPTRQCAHSSMLLLVSICLLATVAHGQSPTASPSIGPLPTRNPTPQPVTPRPTGQPSPAPSTARPTNRPSPAPTTPKPTNEPSFAPTTATPTGRPTFAPSTARPTNQPTFAPSTARPTNAPSFAPSTARPTDRPSSAPSTARPTNQPTFSPSTAAPSSNPTAVPSASPTQPPSSVPSASPTQSPSSRPSSAPSLSLSPTTETASPTFTFQPTGRPTTAVPSDAPSLVPSTTPSITPSSLPSSIPSQSPTLTEQRYQINSLMTMNVMENTMDAGARIDWERSTASHIQRIMENLPVEAPLLQLSVITDISSQILVVPTQEEEGEGIRSRSLQEGGDSLSPLARFPLQVDFLVRVTFRSELSEPDVANMIGEAFNSEEERSQYISRLQQLNGSFDDLVLVEIIVDGKVPDEQPASALEDDGGGGSGSTVIVAAAAAGAAVAVIALGLLVWKRMSAAKEENDRVTTIRTQGRPQAATMASTDPSGKAGYTAEILVDRQDDISTLGDPVFGMMTTTAERDEATASVGNDYDYSAQYQKAIGVASVTGDSSRGRVASLDSQSKYSTSTRTANLAAPPSVFSEDGSFEQQFSGGNVSAIRLEVTVPPGKLGMVIDTPQGSVPVVHAIKPNSVLADKVQVNDRLVSVDGEDVTHMTAVQVSKLISLKADQTRLMVFVRPRSRLDAR